VRIACSPSVPFRAPQGLSRPSIIQMLWSEPDGSRTRRWRVGGWSCDDRIAADNTTFRAGDAYLGSVPGWGMGLTRLPRCVGRNKALDILLMGDTVGAQAALSGSLMARSSGCPMAGVGGFSLGCA